MSFPPLGRLTGARTRPAAASTALLALAAALLASAALAAPARAVPANFWGAVPQGPLSLAQFERLQRGGVDSIRFTIDWTAMQPHPRSEINWGGADAMVASLAKAHLEGLPFLYGAPRWAVPVRGVQLLRRQWAVSPRLQAKACLAALRPLRPLQPARDPSLMPRNPGHN